MLLAELAARLSSGQVTAVDVRSQLDRLCPADRLEDKIELCRLLPAAGVKADAVAGCLTQLEQERPVACQMCGALIPRAELEAHLRRSHRVYQFRDQVRSLEDTLTVVVDAVCSRHGDPVAWATLEAIANEEYPLAARKLPSHVVGPTPAARQRRKAAANHHDSGRNDRRPPFGNTLGRPFRQGATVSLANVCSPAGIGNCSALAGSPGKRCDGGRRTAGWRSPHARGRPLARSCQLIANHRSARQPQLLGWIFCGPSSPARARSRASTACKRSNDWPATFPPSTGLAPNWKARCV